MATSFADPAGGQLSAQQQDPGDQTREVQVNLGADISAYSQQMSAAQAQTDALSASVTQLSNKLSGLAKTAGHVMIGTGVAAGIGLTASIADAASYEHQLGTLRATASVTGASMSELKKGIEDTFTSFPVARSQVVQLTETIANLGVTGPRAISSMTQTFTKLGLATGESAPGLAQGTVQLARQTGNATPDAVAGYSNALVTVSKNQGVAASGVLDFAQSIAPMARQAGIGTAAIEGISAAFQKAGADGAYAANTFNTIIGSITQLSQSGSPELSKYANFVGKTVDQFKQMSGTQQFTSIFQELGKGGGAANNFVQSLGLGTRAVSSVQAVIQSGNLPQAIAQAQNAAQGTGALDTAAGAASSGLSNQMQMLGNQFTQLGEIVGGPLLTPLTDMAKASTAVAHAFNSVLEPLGKLPSVLGVAFSVISTAAGVALTHAGAIGAYSLGRVVLGRGSAPRVGYAAGREAGRAIFGQTMTEQEARDATEIGRRSQIAPGMPEYLPGRMRVPYEAGIQAGMRGPGFFERRFGTGIGGAIQAGMANVRRGGLNLASYSVEEQTRILKDSGLSGLDRSFYTGAQTKLGWRDSNSLRRFIRSGVDFTAANLQAAGGLSGDAAARIMAARGVLDPATGERVGGLPLSLRAPLAGGFRIGQALGALGRVGSAAFSLPGMLALGVGLPLAGQAVGAVKNAINEPTRLDETYNHITKFDQMLDGTSTNLAKFGNAVDESANKLSKFSSVPLAQAAQITSEDKAAIVAPGFKPLDNITDIIKASGGATEPVVQALQGLQISHGGTLTGDYLTAMKQSVLAAMPDNQVQAQNIIDTFQKRYSSGQLLSGFNPVALGTGAGSAATGGFAGSTNSSNLSVLWNRDPDTFKNLFGAATSWIRSGTQDSGAAGVKAAIGNFIPMAVSALTGNYTTQRGQTVSSAAAQMFGGTGTDYILPTIGNEPGVEDTGKNFQTTAQSTAYMINRFVRSPGGRKQLEAAGYTYGAKDADYAAAAAYVAAIPVGLPPPSTSEEFTQLAAGGPFGAREAATKSFQNAVNAPDDTAQQFAESQRLVNEAMKDSNGSFTEANAILMRTASTVGGAASALGTLNEQAAGLVVTLAGFHTATLSRTDQLGEAYKTATAASTTLAAAQAGGKKAPDEVVKAANDAGVALGQAQETERQYFISRIQQFKQFTKDWDRNQQAFTVQVSNTERDYTTTTDRAEAANKVERTNAERDYKEQQKRADEDYTRQRLYAQQDYITQSQRMSDAFHLQQLRANEDFATQLQRQAQTEAQTIYNPYEVTQLKATSDAGTLALNLQQQNVDIQKQLAQVQQLKKQGLSQQSIDTLDLTNPENAQQVGSLIDTMTPALVKQINAEVATRVSATTALTQSPLNMTYRNAVTDFQKQSKRAVDDNKTQMGYAYADYQRNLDRMADAFKTTTERASKDHKTQMGDMAAAFKVQEDDMLKDHITQLGDMATAHQTFQEQTAQDLLDSFTEYTGDFGSIYAQLTASMMGSIGQMVPQLHTLVTADIGKIATEFPGLFAWKPGSVPPPLADSSNAKTPTGPSGYAHPNTTPAPTTPSTSYVKPGTPKPSKPITQPDYSQGFTVPGTGGSQGPKPPPSTRGGGGHGSPIAFAEGGISLTPQVASVSEYGPELHLPLNSRGQDFMAGLIAKSLAQGVTMALGNSGGSASTSYSNDNSISFAGADIQVVAPDPDKMARQLAAKAKLARLTSPVRH